MLIQTDSNMVEKVATSMLVTMLETKCVADNFMMMVTVLAISVPNILYLLTLKRWAPPS